LRDGKVIGLLAMFHKDSGGRLELSSVHLRTEEVSRHDGKIYFGADGYDVDWSKYHHSYIFHMSSSGFHEPEISGIYFLAGDMKATEKPCTLCDDRSRERNRTRRLVRLPKAFRDGEGFPDLLQWLEDNGIESDGVWCSICRDWFPSDPMWERCKHVWWCEKMACNSTPDERCPCKNREECDDIEDN